VSKYADPCLTHDLADVKALTNGSVTYLGPRTLGITSTARFFDEASNARGNSVQAKEQRGQIACQALDSVRRAMGGVNLVSRPAYGALN
jgi:hypothetical protein